ncbi:MAG: ribonucleoside-diphosphate reductase subunit alpha, partial [Flavobacteriales bacterium]|nr:ribonucleoside-diphosphate reductase subunit alpha [Flavobacteriales bacterium]
KQCAKISQTAGGIGLNIHNIRAAGSLIKGINGTSNGVVPMLRVFNNTARYVNQGGGNRKGSFAIYMEPWHADIYDLLNLKKNHGEEESRARDLHYGMWVPDLFMKRVEAGEGWSLFCPNEAPGLADCWDEEFESLYERYEQEGLARKRVKAQDLWFHIMETQIETGTPYIVYKDACNRKSNQKHLGTLKSSSMCTEMVAYSAEDEVAVCNLASISLPKFVTDEGGFDHQKLFDIAYATTRNLNKIIDQTYYPVDEAHNSNMRHRPIGIGTQGLADTLVKLRLPYDSDDAKQLNQDIFETIYYAAMTCSKDHAKEFGHYESYPGSPVSKGQFQFDMWGVTPSDRWEWDVLKEEVGKYGLRNSLLIAPMPTSSTSKILGNNASFEPFGSNITNGEGTSRKFVSVNKHLLKDLVKLGLWNETIKDKLIAANGSIQEIVEIPANIRQLYRTIWELNPMDLIEMAGDRGPYIDQSQSLNLFMAKPNFGKLSNMHFHTWRLGLKTGMYNLRTQIIPKSVTYTDYIAAGQKDIDSTSVQQEEPRTTASDYVQGVPVMVSAKPTTPDYSSEKFSPDSGSHDPTSEPSTDKEGLD